MKQKEMSKYLKLVTVGVGVFLLAFVIWFLPMALREILIDMAGSTGYYAVCGFIWVTAVPAFLCLWRFWEICKRIGEDRSFTKENALALKSMSQYMMTDTVLYAGFLIWFFIAGWYRKTAWLLFPVFLALFISITLMVVCAALSHLVQKASDMREEQDLTI